MQAIVNKDTCIGCGLCPQICPEVFAMEDDTAEVIVNDVPEDSKKCSRKAVEICPVEAISIKE